MTIGPDSYDALVANLTNEVGNVHTLRLRTATHEAGHVIIGTLAGIEVREAGIVNDATGFNVIAPDTEYGEQLGYMLLAGYAAVGNFLGADAEQDNRSSDLHGDPESDLMRSLECARAVNGVDSTLMEQTQYLLALEAKVRNHLATEAVAKAVKHIAACIYTSHHIGPAMIQDIVQQHLT